MESATASASTSSAAPVPSKEPTPRISVLAKAYAFERSLGLPPAEACRRAGGRVENGLATKWERNPSVQAWIGYYRSLGHTEEMLAAKRQRIEDELRLIAHANMSDFIVIKSALPVLNMTAIEEMTDQERRDILAAVKTVKYTENGPTLELHAKLDALNQLRDMHGFKSATKTELTGKNGAPVEVNTTDADRAKALAVFLAKTMPKGE